MKKRLVFPPGCVYIGHRNNRYGLPESKWANPYRKKDGTREERIEKHRLYLLNKAELLAQIAELHGKHLA